MSKNISVNEESLLEIMKKLNTLNEETVIHLNSVSKTIDFAEMEGWNDSNFLKFKEDFHNVDRLLKDGLRNLEDNLIPELKRILLLLEEY